MDGKEFLRRMAQGPDEQDKVFRELYPQLRRRIKMACAKRRIFAEDRIDDIVQGTQLQILQKWPGYRGEGQVWSWVWRIAENLALDWHEQDRDQVSLDDAQEDEGSGQSDDPANQFEALAYEVDHGHRQCVRMVIDELHSEPLPRAGAVRTIDLLWFVIENGKDRTLLADFLKCSLGAAAERKSYALNKLRELCLRFCGRSQCQLDG